MAPKGNRVANDDNEENGIKLLRKTVEKSQPGTPRKEVGMLTSRHDVSHNK
jgi:hypothetical protein